MHQDSGSPFNETGAPSPPYGRTGFLSRLHAPARTQSGMQHYALSITSIKSRSRFASSLRLRKVSARSIATMVKFRK